MASSFGSDARSVLLAGGRKPEVEREHLGEFLFQRYVGGSADALQRGIQTRARPPRDLRRRDVREVRRYWSIDPQPERDVAPEELRALLLDAVSKRLMSDVPLGVLLSGGVDSASVLGLMREAGADSLSSFTIGFDDPLYDERQLWRASPPPGPRRSTTSSWLEPRTSSARCRASPGTATSPSRSRRRCHCFFLPSWLGVT